MAGELAAVGAFGFELGFGSLGAGSFGVGEGALGFELGVVAFAEGVAFAGGVLAGALGLGAGVGFGLAGAAGLGAGCGAGVACGGERVVALALEPGGVAECGGGLLAGAVLGGGDFLRGAAAELVQFGGEGAGCFRGLACGGFRGALVVAGGGEGFGEGLGFRFGLGLAGAGGDGGRLGAAAAGLGVGDLGADAGGVQAGGVLAGGPGQDGGLAQERLEDGERVAVPAAVPGGSGDAGVVVVAAGAVVAAEDPVATASAAGREGVAAAWSLALGRAGDGVPQSGSWRWFPFLFLF